MGELKKLKSFDNTKKKYEDRKKHVEDVLDSVELDEILAQAVCGDDYTLGKIEKSLEDLGTYLLKSSDIESERKIKNSFYRDETRYREYAIGKNTASVDFENREDLHVIHDYEDVELSEDYIFSLFDPEKITEKEKRNVLKIGVKELPNIKNKYLIDEIENLFDEQIDKTQSGRDLLIINYATKGLTDMEISKKISLPKSTTTYVLSKILKK